MVYIRMTLIHEFFVDGKSGIIGDFQVFRGKFEPISWMSHWRTNNQAPPLKGEI